MCNLTRTILTLSTAVSNVAGAALKWNSAPPKLGAELSPTELVLPSWFVKHLVRFSFVPSRTGKAQLTSKLYPHNHASGAPARKEFCCRLLAHATSRNCALQKSQHAPANESLDGQTTFSFAILLLPSLGLHTFASTHGDKRGVLEGLLSWLLVSTGSCLLADVERIAVSGECRLVVISESKGSFFSYSTATHNIAASKSRKRSQARSSCERHVQLLASSKWH